MPTEEHHTAWPQILRPQVQVRPEEAPAECGAHVHLMASNVDS